MNAVESERPGPKSSDRPAPGHQSLRAHLLALALLVLVPTIAIGGGVAFLAVRDHQRDLTIRLTDGAEAIAVALGRHIEARQVMLATLANYPALDEPEKIDGRFLILARNAAGMLRESVALFRPDATPIFRTSDQDGVVPPLPVVVTPIQRALETRRAVVSNLITEPFWLLPIVVPVVRDERVVALLSVRLSPEALLSVISASMPERASFVSILDANGRIIVRAPENQNIGELAPDWLRGVIRESPEGGVTRGTTLAGVETIAAVEAIASAPGWSVVVGVPLSAYSGLFQRPLAWLAAGGAAMLALAVTIALLVSQRLLRPVEALTRHADDVASGKVERATSLGPFSVTEFESLRRALARAEAERRRVEGVQTLLAREVDHRAKNLLAVVQAVVRMTKAGSMAEFVEAVSQRIAALARAHSLLAEKGWRGSNLRAVAEAELTTYAGAGRISLHGGDVHLNAGAVQSISMVLHELATNAAKHGALSTPSGAIDVVWHRDEREGMLYLRWWETSGPRLEGSPTHRGFGSRLVNTTIAGLGGKSERQWSASGLIFEMWAPLARVLNPETS